MKITKQMLVDAKACGDQVELFGRVFPGGATWPDDMEKASRAGLNVWWAIRSFRLSGCYRRWYANGLLEVDETWKNGRFYGYRRGWHPNGQLWVDEAWRGDERHGRRREWYPDGQLRLDEMWEHGERHGRRRVWYADGKLCHDEMWEHGRLVR